jgi:Flp pilus assembly protein TadG
MKPTIQSSTEKASTERASTEKASTEKDGVTLFRANRLVKDERRSRIGGFVDDRGGAAMVEFALAILPLMTLIFGMMQWSIVAYVHLLVKHSAYSIARCEAVVHPQMPDSGDEDKDCLATDATNPASVIGMLFAHVYLDPASTFTITTPTLAGQYEQKTNTVQVTLNYKCTIPLGNLIACPGGGPRGSELGYMKLTESASFPNQGSAYQKIWMTGS